MEDRRLLLRVLLLLMASGFAPYLNAEEKNAELVEPAVPERDRSAPPVRNGSAPPAAENPKASAAATTPVSDGEREPIVVDEPGFKARAVFPKPPAVVQNAAPASAETRKATQQRWAVPSEEGVGETAKAESDAEASAPEELSPALAKALAKERSGAQPASLVGAFKEIVNAEPENAAARYHLGLALARSGQLALGLPELEKAVLLDPKEPRYQCAYGQAALQAGWVEKALSACEAAALAVPANARYQSALGDALLAAGQVAPAAEAYTRAVNLDPHNAGYIFNLGLACLHARAFARAIEIFNEAIRLRPDHPPYYCNRGLAYESSKDIKKAVEDYSQALKLDKNNAYGHFLLAGVYSDPDDPTYANPTEAVEHALKAVKLTKSGNAQYLMGLARALRVSRNYAQAADAARQAIALEPRDDYRKELGQFESLRDRGFAK